MVGCVPQRGELREAVNAFRGVAAILVAIYHLHYFTTFDWFGQFPILQFGYLGVDFFFILSGLIISHVYLHRAVRREPGFWAEFLWLRIARLGPLHMLLMVFMLIAALVLPGFDAAATLPDRQALLDWLSLTLLVRQWFLPDGFVWNSPAWSISAEFFAYTTLFPLFTWLARGQLKAIAGIILLALGLACFLLLWGRTGTLNITHGAGPLWRVTGGFAIGTAVYLFLSEARRHPRHDQLLFMAIGLLPIATLFVLTKTNSLAAVEIVILSAVVLLVSLAYLAEGPTARLLARPLPNHLAEISFALYMCHVPVMSALRWAADWFGLERGFGLGLALIGATLVAAHLLHRHVEAPSRKLLRHWYETRRQLQAGAMLNPYSAGR